jgi:hypothetical protein
MPASLGTFLEAFPWSADVASAAPATLDYLWELELEATPSGAIWSIPRASTLGAPVADAKGRRAGS